MCYGFRIFGEYVVVIIFSGVLSFSNQQASVTNPMSILYISPMTDEKNHASYALDNWVPDAAGRLTAARSHRRKPCGQGLGLGA